MQAKIRHLREKIEASLLEKEKSQVNTYSDIMDIDEPNVDILFAEIESEIRRLNTLVSSANLNQLKAKNEELNRVSICI